MCCSFKAQAASDYLSHVSQHSIITSKAKRTYINMRIEELRELTATALAQAIPKDESSRSTTRKRKRNERGVKNHMVGDDLNVKLDSSVIQAANNLSLFGLEASLQAWSEAASSVAPILRVANYPSCGR